MANKARCLLLRSIAGPIGLVGLATAIGCSNPSASSTEQAATGILGVDDAVGSGSFDARPPGDGSGSGSGGVVDAGVPDGGSGSDAGGGSGSDADAGAPDDPGEDDGIPPIIDPTPIDEPDPSLDDCADLAQRDAMHINLPDDNARGRSYECFNRWAARVGGPQLADQDPGWSPIEAFDGPLPLAYRTDPDNFDAEEQLYLTAGPPGQPAPTTGEPAPSEVLKLLEGVDLQGIADDKYDCEPAKADTFPNPKSGDNWRYMYIPGIQAFDNVPPLDNVGTANRYIDMAEWGADSRNNTNTFTFPVSEISRWRMFHYHNEPSVTAGQPGKVKGKVFRKRKFFGPPGGVVGSVENWGLATHRATQEDDKKEVRNLAAWVSAKTQADFVANPPKPGPGTTAPMMVGPNGPQITAADFTAWYNARIAENQPGQWRWFIREAAFVMAHSYYCRKPVFAHSGGGPVKLALLRLLDAYSESLPGKPLQKIKNRNNTPWHTYGLEEVISVEARDFIQPLPSYKDRLVIYNYVESTNGKKGSTTWRDLIKPEIERVGQKPLVKEYQNLNIKVAPETLGHAWIGWTPLYTGAFYNPKTLFPMY